MKKTFGKSAMRKLPLAVAVSMLSSAAVHAVEFNFGDLGVQVDNTVSYGVAWRTSDRDKGQIMTSNGSAIDETTYGSSYNYDDGTLNYSKGDIYTNAVKWSGDLELNYQNYGGFFRARAYYDTALMDEDTDFKPLNDATKAAAGKGAELLDAYIWADYEIAETPVNARIGRQVISWGESTFIQGGINSVNPVDASAFRKPGAEVKEGLLPVNMVYTSLGLSADITLEAFYQLEWEKTRTDPCGTFFSTVDFVADGCGPVLLSHSEDEVNGTFYPLANVDRMEDDEPKDSGQYGLALRTYTELFGGSEFGFYYMNIHSRVPYINGKLLVNTETAPVDFNTKRMMYQIAYPEDIQIAGVSFAGSLDNGASISGEISYKPDLPIQWNAFELIFAGVPGAHNYSRFYQQRKEEYGGDAENLVGTVFDGFDKFDVWQAQATYIQFFDRVMGADRLALVAEVGVNYVQDLPDTDDARYGRSGAYGIGTTTGGDVCSDNTSSLKNENTDYCTDDGYVTELSGGIRLRASMDFNNAFAGVNVTPTLSVAYDKGNGPEPGAQFLDDRLTTGLGVSFVYLNKTSVDLSYTNFSGGDYNQMVDRDNVSLSAKYSF